MTTTHDRARLALNFDNHKSSSRRRECFFFFKGAHYHSAVLGCPGGGVGNKLA
jgi:hypothetical protein